MCEIEMTIEQAREQFAAIRVHPPTLDEHMQPAFQLLNMKCPIDRDGLCFKCDKFLGVDLSGSDGVIYSYMSFDGFCDTK